MISQADLEVFLDIGADTDTALLIDLEGAAVEWFQNRTGGRFFGLAAAVTEYHRGTGTEELFLEEVPTIAAAAIIVVEQAYEGDSGATTLTDTDDDGYTLRGEHLVRKGGYLWKVGYEYKVTYSRGYTEIGDTTPDTIDAPDDVRQAIKQLVAFWYNAGDPAAGSSGLTSEKIGNYSYTRGALFSNADAMLNAIPGLRETVHAWKRTHFV